MLVWISSLVLLFLALPGQTTFLQEAPTSTPTPDAVQATINPQEIQSTSTLTTTQTITPTVSILYPVTGQALQGSIAISGNTMAENFSSAELLFGYDANPTNTWFLIQSYDRPISGGTIALWDTTTITDGTYQLRLVVWFSDGSQLEQKVTGLRVRNYSPIETNTPTPVTPTATLPPGETPIPTPTMTIVPPTVTPLPTNPAEITSQKASESLLKGALGIFGIFAVMGIYQLIKGRIRR